MNPRRSRGFAARAIQYLAVLPLLALVTFAEWWEKLPFLCRYCGNAIEPSTMGEGERVAWCDNCKQVCEPPLLKVPGWVASVIVLLLVKLHAGL